MTEKYAELRAAIPATTPGPWFVHDYLGHAVVTVGSVRIASNTLCTNRPEEDAAYIAACHPEAIRALLAERDAFKYALEMIAGIRPCADTLMGNADIASAALAQEQGD